MSSGKLRDRSLRLGGLHSPLRGKPRSTLCQRIQCWRLVSG